MTIRGDEALDESRLSDTDSERGIGTIIDRAGGDGENHCGDNDERSTDDGD
jgi:hypothetical protein